MIKTHISLIFLAVSVTSNLGLAQSSRYDLSFEPSNDPFHRLHLVLLTSEEWPRTARRELAWGPGSSILRFKNVEHDWNWPSGFQPSAFQTVAPTELKRPVIELLLEQRPIAAESKADQGDYLSESISWALSPEAPAKFELKWRQVERDD